MSLYSSYIYRDGALKPYIGTGSIFVDFDDPQMRCDLPSCGRGQRDHQSLLPVIVLDFSREVSKDTHISSAQLPSRHHN